MKRDSAIYQFIKKASQPPSTLFWRVMNTCFCLVSITYGSFVYKALKREHPGKTIIVVPTLSIGDLIYFKASFDSLLRMNQIEDYIIVMCANLKKGAQAIDYKHVGYRSVGEVGALNMYIHFLSDRLDDAIDGHIWQFFDYKGALNKQLMNYPVFHGDSKAISDFFVKTDAKRGESIILAPYEKTLTVDGLRLLPIRFWEDLSSALIQSGYTVFTNCANTELEPVIAGTRHIFPKYEDIQEYVSYAGGMVAIRSGFVDFSCCAEAKKVVLYPSESFRREFSTNEVGFSNDIVELNYENIDFETELGMLMERVLAEFPKLR